MGIHLPPHVALLLTLGLIVFLFRRDIRERPHVSRALWLPVFWLMITCSRPISQWLKIFGLPITGAHSLEEGSPLDAWFYLILIVVASFYLVNNRRVSLSQIVQDNGWFVAFFLYCLISIAWSDFPYVAFKRWIKILGDPLIVLMVLTEPEPREALTRLMKRCAYVIVPVSILFIKYYPELGRNYDPWTGSQMSNGIADGKNMLGAVCLVLGFFFFWHLLQTWQGERNSWRRKELWLIAGFLIGILWLLSQAHSGTSLVSLSIGVMVVVFVGLRSINKNVIGTYMLAGMILFVAADWTFGISGLVFKALGRDPTLTGRTEIWRQVLAFHTNPIFGTGFESFWLGERLQQMGEKYWFQLVQAHNGYLEIYLNLGLIGLAIVIGLIIATYWKIRPELFQNFEWGRYRLGFLVAVVLYNWAEAAFKMGHPVWFAFCLIAINYPRRHFAPVETSSMIIERDEETKFAYFQRDFWAASVARDNAQDLAADITVIRSRRRKRAWPAAGTLAAL
jgi:exopolysaccharide production protein ExoQ